MGGKEKFPDYIISKIYPRDEGTYPKKILTIVEAKRDNKRLKGKISQLEEYVKLARHQSGVPDVRSYLILGNKYQTVHYDPRLGTIVGKEEHSVFVDVDPSQDNTLASQISSLAIRFWNVVADEEHSIFVDVDPPHDNTLTSELSRLAIRFWN